MNLKDIYSKKNQIKSCDFSKKKPIISFEVFPPKEDIEAKCEQIIVELNNLKKFDPKLISVTYGAGGSTKSNSFELADMIKEQVKIEVMPHFTCVNSSFSFISDCLTKFESLGIENVLALRGDLPKDRDVEHMDFKYASELVNFIRTRTELAVAVAGYPEGHIESESLNKDIDYLKKKVDEGASVIYTQLFFDNDYFYKYVDKVRAVGIDLPIVPGLLPITNHSQLDRMVSLCGVKVPKKLLEKLDKFKDSPNEIKKIGVDFACQQVSELLDFEADGLHFYILNKSNPTCSILDNIL